MGFESLPRSLTSRGIEWLAVRCYNPPVRGALLFLVMAALAAPAAVSADAAPPGATAQCRDGSYSYSQHHSGTCSHHGGVAVWLDGSASSSPVAGASPSAQLGTTMLVAGRTRTSGCTRGAEPDRRCSPGAYYSGLTTDVICSSSFRTSTIRNVPQTEKFAVEQEYRLRPGYYGRTLEIDHIVPLELGGSNDIANLFPEAANAHPGYRAKDRLENRLHDLVCSATMTLGAARIGIAGNWEGLYRQVFGTAPIG